jgi:hypothetical protein
VGYAPIFNGLLSSLRTIYATPIVEDMLYNEWTKQFCKGREVEWLRVYDFNCSDRDIFDKLPTWSDDSEYSESQYSDSQHSDSE